MARYVVEIGCGVSVKPPARAYANQGRWIADCPRPHCGSAELLVPFQAQFHCTACHAEAPCEWPRDARDITAVLAARGNPRWMNWFPADHPLAVAARCPHGQSVTDLLAEDDEHAAELTEWASFGQVETGMPGWARQLGPVRKAVG